MQQAFELKESFYFDLLAAVSRRPARTLCRLSAIKASSHAGSSIHNVNQADTHKSILPVIGSSSHMK